MIDLHCHSHFSDGILSPSALLDEALAAGIGVLALTDHDTVAGMDELHQSAQKHSIRIINGIELSTQWKKNDIHILGLNITIEDEKLLKLIHQQNQNRIARAIEIGKRLSAFSIENAYEKACTIAGHTRAARPHFAQVIVNEGHAADLQIAFKRYLGRGRPAYVPTAWLSVEEAVQGIVSTGGNAVIAHPLKYKLTRSKLHELIKAFQLAGGIGIEVVSGEMTQPQVNEMASLCMRFQLYASTGSDYHGQGLSRVALGRQRFLPANCIPIWDKWNI